MNIVAILANGVGNRFDSNVPKQFHKINKKMIIEYVLEAVATSKQTDKIVISTNIECNAKYITELESKFQFDIVCGGNTRNHTLKNVIDYIDSNYNCQNIIICDSVRPMITDDLIDSYFEFLNEYDTVVTAQKITDSLGCVDFRKIDREDYYLMQSPEAFRFNLLKNSFDPNSNLTEVTQQLPQGSKIKLNFNFRHNIKLTYPEDLKLIEILIKESSINLNIPEIFDSIERFKNYLHQEYPTNVNNWLKNLQQNLPKLFKKWKIESFEVLKSSHFGIVIFAKSLKHGDCVVKIIPKFINRYEQEKLCYQTLSSNYMCNLYDYDDNLGVLLLEKCEICNSANFGSKNNKLLKFFSTVKNNKIKGTTIKGDSFHDYSQILHSKQDSDNISYKKDIIMNYVSEAINLFDKTFNENNYRLIHGDIHRHNIVERNNELVAIDPIGYIAPFEIEIARYIGTELTDKPTISKATFHDMVKTLSVFASEETLISAIFIDIVFRLHNSIFENDNYILTDKWLNILKELF